MTEAVMLEFDPRREQVKKAMQAATANQSPELYAQAVADAIMAACVIGEVLTVRDEEEYFKMIRAALPNAKKIVSDDAKNQLN